MKKLTLLSIILFATYFLHAQSVSVNTDGSIADASAILDIKSTTKGMLVPRVTTIQRTTIVAPANGLLVYDTDTKSFWYYNSTAWTNLTGGGSLTLPYEATVNAPGTAFKIANGSTAIEGAAVNNAGVYGYSENGSGLQGNSTNGFGVYATSSLATAIRASSFNSNPTIHSTNSNATGSAIRGEASGTSGVGVFGVGSSSSSYGVRGTNGSGTGVSGFSTSGYGMLASSNSGVGLRTSSTTGNALEVFGKLKIYGAGVNVNNGAVLTSDAEGNASWKLNRVAFKAKGQGTIADGTALHLIANAEEYDYPNHFNTANGEFTVPVNGVYSFGTHAFYDLLNDVDDNITYGEVQILVYRNGSPLWNHALVSTSATIENGTDDSRARVSVSGDLKLQAGDIVKVQGYQTNSADASIAWNIVFFGHLVFAE